jgi:hypothetical protein
MPIHRCVNRLMRDASKDLWAAMSKLLSSSELVEGSAVGADGFAEEGGRFHPKIMHPPFSGWPSGRGVPRGLIFTGIAVVLLYSLSLTFSSIDLESASS